MKIIELLNKIANDEINEDIEIVYQNGFITEYSTIRNFFDRYILDKENLNQEIKISKNLEEKKIPEKLDEYEYDTANEILIIRKINDIIDYLKSKGE